MCESFPQFLVHANKCSLVSGPQNGSEQVYKVTGGSRDKPKGHLKKYHQMGASGPIDPANPEPPQVKLSTGDCPDLREANLFRLFKLYLIKWIVLAHIAYSQVENEHFRGLVYFINLTAEFALPRSGNTVRAWMLKLYNVQRLKIAQMLRESPYQLHYGFDLWTSPNGLAILGIVVHWMDAEDRKHDTLVGLRAMDSSHSGEHMFEVLWEVIEELGVQHKIGYFILDNAHSNTQALRCLEHRLLLEDTPHPFTSSKRRMHCFGHVLNLIAKRILFGESVNVDVGADCADAEDEQAAITQEVSALRWVYRKDVDLQIIFYSKKECGNGGCMDR
jgi:hypothetical protein